MGWPYFAVFHIYRCHKRGYSGHSGNNIYISFSLSFSPLSFLFVAARINEATNRGVNHRVGWIRWPIRDTIVSYFNRLWIIAKRRVFTERGGIRGPIYSRRKKERNEPRSFISQISSKRRSIGPPLLLFCCCGIVVKFRKNYRTYGGEKRNDSIRDMAGWR